MSLEDEIRGLREDVQQLAAVMKRIAGADPTIAPRATVTRGEKNIEELWTVDEVAAYLKMSRSSIYTRIGRHSDALPVMRVGSMLRFDPKAVKAWVTAQVVRPATLKSFPR